MHVPAIVVAQLPTTTGQQFQLPWNSSSVAGFTMVAVTAGREAYSSTTAHYAFAKHHAPMFTPWRLQSGSPAKLPGTAPCHDEGDIISGWEYATNGFELFAQFGLDHHCKGSPGCGVA